MLSSYDQKQRDAAKVNQELAAPNLNPKLSLVFGDAAAAAGEFALLT